MNTIRNEDLRALQSYVTAKDASQYDHLHQNTVLIDITHSNLKQRQIEIRFDKHSTISAVRSIIHQKSGTPPCFQHLQIKSCSQVLMEIPPGSQYENHKLGFFDVESGMCVHCIDTDPYSKSRNGQYEDVSLVEKYRMSDEDYDKRKGTLRSWEREQKRVDKNFTLAKHAREHREKMEAMRQHKLGLPLPEGWGFDSYQQTVVRVEKEKDEVARVALVEEKHEYDITSVNGISCGMRCQVRPGGRRGQVYFVGEVKEIGSGGYWVGVKFDEPVGKGDGRTSTGKRYFDADPGYGGFCRGKNVETGDFPEKDIFDDSDSEDEL